LVLVLLLVLLVLRHLLHHCLLVLAQGHRLHLRRRQPGEPSRAHPQHATPCTPPPAAAAAAAAADHPAPDTAALKLRRSG
jgi:hypothetical protein